MRCKEVKKGLVAYLEGEVMPSERTLIEAHLAGCASCERELSALGSSRRRVVDSLKTMAAEAAPSPQAWSRLQARLSEDQSATSNRQGDRRMKLRWRIALGTAAAIVIAAGIIAGVPTTRAAAGNFFAHVFNIDSSHPVKFAYLPQGFEPQPLFLTGSAQVAAEGESQQWEEQALYQNGDLFLSVKTSSDVEQALPAGEAADVNGLAAVLRTGLSGTVGAPDPPELKEGMNVTTGGSGEPSASSGPSVRAGGGPEQGQSIVTSGASASGGAPPELPTITYDSANALTWVIDGTRVELLTNLSADELLKIAEGLTLPE